MKTMFAAALLLGFAGTAQAHEVWIERDGSGPARIYLGEPADVLPEGGDPEFKQLKAPKLLPASTAQQVRRAGFIEVAVPAGDVRAWDDNVFAPWDDAGKKQGLIYYARAGNKDVKAALPFEIAPVKAGGTSFVLTRDGKPVADSPITIVSPAKWSKSMKTDAQGGFTVPLREKGRYLVAAAIKEDGAATVAGNAVDAVHHITTITFVTK